MSGRSPTGVEGLCGARWAVQSEFTALATHSVAHSQPVQPMPGRHLAALLPRRSLVSSLACSLTALLLVAPLAAQEREERAHARLPESVNRVERETGGKVLQVRPIRRGDREIYRMKVLTPDGRVKIMQDDPKWPRERTREASPRQETPVREREPPQRPPPDYR